MSRLAFREEAAENDDLSESCDDNDDGLTDGPVLNPLVQVLGKRPALRLAQLVMCLIVGDRPQRLVCVEHRRLHLPAHTIDIT